MTLCGPLGDEFPGISAAGNQRFAHNVLRMLRDAPRLVEDSWADMYRFINNTENNLYHVTKSVLSKSFGKEWFHRGIPEQVRNKCRERAERERKGFPDWSYLDILDYKTVWRANWSMFQAPYGPDVSREKGTAFFGGLNELRKMTMHATRQVSTGRVAPTVAEVAELRGYMAHVQWLLEVANDGAAAGGK
jgi:hypothetical protein